MWSLLPVAVAGGLDADGLSLPVSDGSAGQAVLLETVPTLPRRNVALGLQTALSVRPLIRQGGETTPLVGGAGTAYLQAVGMATSWLGGEIHLPLRYAASGAGPALGDLRGAVVLRPVARADLGLALRVGLSAPLGSTARFSGAGVFVPRAQLSARYSGPIRADVAFGLAFEGAETIETDLARGGFTLDGGLGLAYTRGRFGAGVSGRFGLPLAGAIRLRRGVGIEVGAHGSMDLTDRLAVRLLATRALAGAAGFPDWRFGAGVSYRVGSKPEGADPAGVEPLVFEVVSPDGLPVAGAKVEFEEGAETTDARGRVSHAPGRWKATVRAKGLVPGTLTDDRRRLELQWAPTPVRIEVTSETGTEVDARIVGAPMEWTEKRGFVGELAPGTHEIRIEAEGFGTQSRTLEIPFRRTEPLVFEVVLVEERGDGSLDLRIADPQGRGIEAAEVRLDGLSIGTSATGSLHLEGLPEGTVKVEVESPYFGDFAADVDLSDGPGFLSINPYYAPGTVRVVAEGPDGPIRDGTVFLEGPRALAPLDLSPLGERLIRLGEGTWDVLLSSPALGLQERRVSIDRRSPVPVDVYFELVPQGGGEAELEVRITDRDGRPLADVGLEVDGVSVGSTSTEGVLRLHGMPERAVVLHATGPSLQPVSSNVELVSGLQQARLRMDWNPGTVQVRARAPSGPLDALATFAGPAPYEGGQLGPSGRRRFADVPAGDWEVVASHPLGMEVALTVVEAGDPHLTDLFLQLGQEQGDATLNLSVVDPEGQPVEGAWVALDDVELAQTAGGGDLRASGLRSGVRRLTVRAPGHLQVEQALSLPATHSLTLPWAKGVVDLIVTRAGEPVNDAMVFFDGPRTIPAAPLGADGSRRVALGAGSWTAVIASPTAGLWEEPIEIGSDADAPREVRVDLVPTTGLLVRVRDERGNPIAGVGVRVDGAEIGRTGSSGTLQVARSAAVTVELEDPRIVVPAVVQVPEGRGEQLFEVSWQPREVALVVEAAGEPVAASIHAIGPRLVQPVVLDASGQGIIALPPGSWELTASAEGLGVARRQVRIRPDGGIEPVRFQLRDARLILEQEAIRLEAVLFGSDEYVITPAQSDLIEEIAATVLADPTIVGLEVQGHTDDTGGPAYNFELSRLRAQAVVQALIERGVPPDMATARGFGQTRPIAPNDDESGRARNRRVHFEIEREDDLREDR